MMTMTSSPIEVQQMFANLFKVGTEMQVTVIPSGNEDTILVQSTGGCVGTLSPGYKFPVGTLISAIVTEIINRKPVFEPTQEWLLAKTPQKGRVVFSTPLGVVVELQLKEKIFYAVYQPAQGLSEELQAALKERQEVIVCSLTKTSEGTYEAQTLNVIPEAEKPQPTDPMAPWSKEKITEVAKISATMWRQAKLGKVFAVEVISSTVAQMSKGGMVTLKEGKFPQYIKRAFVRVVYIDKASKEVLVEFIKADHTSKKPVFVAKAEDPTAVGYRNDEVVQKARENGSLWFAGPNQMYKLGTNYRVKMEAGVPTFEDKAYPAFTFNVIIDDRCQEHIADGEEVICRVNHISRQSQVSFTFNVSILRVL